jgi:hypothetical protein
MSYSPIDFLIEECNIAPAHAVTKVTCGEAPPALRLEEAHLPFASICTPTSFRGRSCSSYRILIDSGQSAS